MPRRNYEDMIRSVQDYIAKYPNNTAYDITKDIGVMSRYLRKMVDEGRVQLTIREPNAGTLASMRRTAWQLGDWVGDIYTVVEDLGGRSDMHQFVIQCRFCETRHTLKKALLTSYARHERCRCEHIINSNSRKGMDAKPAAPGWHQALDNFVYGRKAA